MFDIFGRNVEKSVKDYTSAPSHKEVAGIVVPAITLEKYPEIIDRGTRLIYKLGEKIVEQEGKSLEEVLENLDAVSLIKYIPLIIKVAAEEFFGFLAFVLDIDIEKIKKLGLADLTRIINGLREVNEMAVIQAEVQNFMMALVKAKVKKEEIK